MIFVKSRYKFRIAENIPYSLKTERVSLGKRALNQHVRVFQAKLKRVFAGKINVRLVENHHASLVPANFLQLSCGIATAAGRVWSGYKAQSSAEIPDFSLL